MRQSLGMRFYRNDSVSYCTSFSEQFRIDGSRLMRR